MKRPRTFVLRCVICAVTALAVAACGPSASGSDASDKTSGGGASDGPAGGSGLTFGTQPCGRLVAFEEIAAATGIKPAIVDVVTETQCNYEDQAGDEIVSVDRATDPSGQATCAVTGAGATEPLAGLGDSATWSASTRTVCFVKGGSRVRIALGHEVADARTTTVALATKAAARLP